MSTDKARTSACATLLHHNGTLVRPHLLDEKHQRDHRQENDPQHPEAILKLPFSHAIRCAPFPGIDSTPGIACRCAPVGSALKRLSAVCRRFVVPIAAAERGTALEED